MFSDKCKKSRPVFTTEATSNRPFEWATQPPIRTAVHSVCKTKPQLGLPKKLRGYPREGPSVIVSIYYASNGEIKQHPEDLRFVKVSWICLAELRSSFILLNILTDMTTTLPPPPQVNNLFQQQDFVFGWLTMLYPGCTLQVKNMSRLSCLSAYFRLLGSKFSYSSALPGDHAAV